MSLDVEHQTTAAVGNPVSDNVVNHHVFPRDVVPTVFVPLLITNPNVPVRTTPFQIQPLSLVVFVNPKSVPGTGIVLKDIFVRADPAFQSVLQTSTAFQTKFVTRVSASLFVELMGTVGMEKFVMALVVFLDVEAMMLVWIPKFAQATNVSIHAILQLLVD